MKTPGLDANVEEHNQLLNWLCALQILLELWAEGKLVDLSDFGAGGVTFAAGSPK